MKKIFALLMFVTLSVTAQKKPNIVYILTDDLGIGDLKAFNKYSKIATPHLNKMADEGMIFTDAHTGSSVCTPTRYGIVTGRYAWRTTLKDKVIYGNAKALVHDDEATIATVAKKNGYTTAFIGKSHLGWNWGLKSGENNGYYIDKKKSTVSEGQIDFSKKVTHTPNDIGFDYHYGTCASLDMSPYVYIKQGQPTETKVEKIKGWGGKKLMRAGIAAHNFVHEDVMPNYVDHGIEYIQKNAKGNKPFLLYLPLPAPHTPILPKKEWQGKSGLNEYADFVMMIDDYMGKLFKTIKDQGIEDNTLVVFTSDNGCSPKANFNELLAKGHNPSAQFRGTKSDIWDGGHRVPFIVKWPAKVKAGSVCNTTICTTDLLATIADITNYKLKANEGVDSYSMLPLLEGKVKNYDRPAVVHHSVYGKYAIRKGDWKLAFTKGSGGWSNLNTNFLEKITGDNKDYENENIEGKGVQGNGKVDTKFQLYNMKTDVGERNNVYAQHPEIVKELTDLMVKYIEDGRSTEGAKQENAGGDPAKWIGVHFMEGSSEEQAKVGRAKDQKKGKKGKGKGKKKKKK